MPVIYDISKECDPCPFCESKDLGITFTVPYIIYCRKCGLKGPESRHAEMAIIYWNTLPREEDGKAKNEQ